MKFLTHIGVYLALAIFLAYLPFSGLLFALKNDAFTAYFPVKYFMSESIHAGSFPWWNPYLNYGLPQYADMSSGFWNPITLLISSTVGYNPYTFSLEELLYLFLAGFFMFRLCSYWNLRREIRFIAGLSFACCGFMVGQLQHFNWISGAAWLPFVMHSYLLLWKDPNNKTVVTAALAFFLFSSSAHPGLLVGAFYFFLIIFCAQLFQHIRNKPNTGLVQKALASHAVLLVIFSLLSIAMLMSWTEILGYMDRGTKITLAASQVGPTVFGNWISFLLPFGITKASAWFQNDVAFRNVYMGLLSFIFLWNSIVRKKSGWQTLLIFTGLLFLLLSSGGVFKQIAYHVLPFTSYVRLDAEFRIFGIFCFIIAAAIGLNRLVNEGWIVDRKLRIVFVAVAVGIIVFVLIGLIGIFQSHPGIFLHFPSMKDSPDISRYLKQLVDTIELNDTLVIQGCIQLVFLYLFWRALAKRSLPVLIRITALELILTTLLNLPFTGVGQTPLSNVNSLISRAPQGLPMPDLSPVKEHRTIPKPEGDFFGIRQTPDWEQKTIGNWGFYSKQIGNTEFMPYPVLLKTTRNFFESAEKLDVDKNAFAYLASPDAMNSVTVLGFRGGMFGFKTFAKNENKFILKQNLYPGWRYFLDGKKVQPVLIHESFMSLELPPGVHFIEFSFEKPILQLAAWISLLSFILVLIFLTYTLFSHKTQ